MVKNIFYFNSGGIGEFLMTLFFMENVHINNKHINLYVAVSKNKKLLQELVRPYDYINILEISKKDIFSVVRFIFKFFFQINFAITQMTFGKIPLPLKFIAKSITLRGESALYGFDDGFKLNKFFIKSYSN